jgi:hypothetical protein
MLSLLTSYYIFASLRENLLKNFCCYRPPVKERFS